MLVLALAGIFMAVFYSLSLAGRQQNTGSLHGGSFQIRSSPSSLHVTLPHFPAIVSLAKHDAEYILVGCQEYRYWGGVVP